MPLDTAVKKEIIAGHATNEGDTGSPEVQVALLTRRINDLTEHLKVPKHDHHSPALDRRPVFDRSSRPGVPGRSPASSLTREPLPRTGPWCPPHSGAGAAGCCSLVVLRAVP